MLYAKPFEFCFEATDGTTITSLPDSRWSGRVTKKTLISVWKKLRSDSVVERDFEWFKKVHVEPEIDEIVILAKIIEFEVDSNDIDEQVEEHRQALTTEQLM